MIIRTANALSRFFYRQSLGLMLLRITTGLVFFTHGWMKVGDLARTAGMFAHMGFPAWIGYFIAWLELLGGLALVLGIATRFFGVVFAIEMLVAAFVVGFGHGISFELYLALASLSLALAGSGAWSAYPMECRDCGGVFCTGTTCVVAEE
jgi:uncharacterized membrane protein YphA (DoxX/SURF4 family)